jgi:hypothetical protein
MKLLLNDKEIAHFLRSQLDQLEALKAIPFETPEINDVINYIHVEKAKRKYDLDKMRKKFKDRIGKAVSRDLFNYMTTLKASLADRKQYQFSILHKKIEHFIKQFGEENICELYRADKRQNFIKSTGYHLDSNAELMRRKNFTNYQEDCLIRNTVSNEQLLISKIDNSYPFWFIDSGYTNFLEPNKKWHRLVRNHLHYGKFFDSPVDRLGAFKSFPQQWRTGGDRILVIEPGHFAAGIFHVDIEKWKYDVEAELRKHTDKKIVFREKLPKKSRPRLYKELCDEDYWCVVNINSNAATESVWAGIPAITLDRHITNPVTKNKLSDVNDLYRGSLAQWLSMLSYSQFTYDELIDGTAGDIVKKYHG